VNDNESLSDSVWDCKPLPPTSAVFNHLNPGCFGTATRKEGSHGVDEYRKYPLASKPAGLADL